MIADALIPFRDALVATDSVCANVVRDREARGDLPDPLAHVFERGEGMLFAIVSFRPTPDHGNRWLLLPLVRDPR